MERDFIRSGEIAAATYNVNRDPKKHSTPFGAPDIFPWLADGQAEAEPRVASDAEIDLFFTGLVTQDVRDPNKRAKRLERRRVSRSEMIDG